MSVLAAVNSSKDHHFCVSSLGDARQPPFKSRQCDFLAEYSLLLSVFFLYRARLSQDSVSHRQNIGDADEVFSFSCCVRCCFTILRCVARRWLCFESLTCRGLWRISVFLLRWPDTFDVWRFGCNFRWMGSSTSLWRFQSAVLLCDIGFFFVSLSLRYISLTSCHTSCTLKAPSLLVKAAQVAKLLMLSLFTPIKSLVNWSCSCQYHILLPSLLLLITFYNRRAAPPATRIQTSDALTFTHELPLAPCILCSKYIMKPTRSTFNESSL